MTEKPRNTLAIISLGCPKNQVDADVFCRTLIKNGFVTTANLSAADTIIINTCGFIDSAKEEAIENILNATAFKAETPHLKVVVTGCLAERYRDEITKEIPEVDAVIGIGSYGALASIIKRLHGEDVAAPIHSYGAKKDLQLGGERVVSTPRHYAWLKISEGCSNCCSYCAIPLIRGPLRSRSVEDCLAEAAWLADQGVKELVLVAQDVTAYGEDLGKNQIIELLDELNKINGIQWIRILYAYPEYITEEFVDAILRNKKVLHYLDVPIQHISDDILTSMRRKANSAKTREVLDMLRRKMPDITLRTSLIAGYPGETEQQFEQLCQFVKDYKFDRLGCFAYSPEEGTLAEKLPNQIPEEERRRRADIVMQTQSHISEEKLKAKIGQAMRVICDELDGEEGYWLCRSAADAPEIDANVLLPADAPLTPGEFYTVRIVDADMYDLYAQYEEI